MEQHFKPDTVSDKKEHYKQFLVQYAALIENEHDIISVMANTAAALKESFGFFWVGFYLVKTENELSLGPFQGNVACYRIKKGCGVCGTAWQEECTQVVPDVNLFPGHIACSSESRSEIVVPIINNGTVIGVLDIDSKHKGMFDDTDRTALEELTGIMTASLFHHS